MNYSPPFISSEIDIHYHLQMGLVHTQLFLQNPLKPELQQIETVALVDTGVIHLCIPEHIALQLELPELKKREVTIADGSKKLCSYVGPVRIQFQNHSCFTDALVIGDTLLLGAILMEDMDLIVHPAQLKLMTNPANPNIPASVVK